MDNSEQKYIRKRVWKGKLHSILFYLFRVMPINKRKIVFCCIEGTTGYTCNPKYIAEEMIRRNINYRLVWLVNDTSKEFPPQIKVVHNTLWNRAYELTTSAIWVDNSRKQLEVRKRKGQFYMQTWHAKLGFKPTGLDRGESFSRIAYLVSKHDSDIVDFWLSNSDWYDKMLPTGSLYEGKPLRVSSPRCDILINGRKTATKKIRKKFNLSENVKIIMYAPTFRGGSQGTNRSLKNENEYIADYANLVNALEKKFGGKWYIFLRNHPQLTVRHIEVKSENSDRVIDVSKIDDMYELLAGCNAFLTDYSSAAFDALVMKIPIFLYAADYKEYESERGNLLWNIRELPFPLAETNEELKEKIENFEEQKYQKELEKFMLETGMVEDGHGSRDVVDFICNKIIIGKKDD